jgi:hypothetical protein
VQVINWGAGYCWGAGHFEDAGYYMGCTVYCSFLGVQVITGGAGYRKVHVITGVQVATGGAGLYENACYFMVYSLLLRQVIVGGAGYQKL